LINEKVNTFTTSPTFPPLALKQLHYYQTMAENNGLHILFERWG